MAKILTDLELLEVVRAAVVDAEIDCGDAYLYFLEDLAELIAKHFGGDRGTVEYSLCMEAYTAAFHINESVPADGGVFNKYDTDVTWKDGIETEKAA